MTNPQDTSMDNELEPNGGNVYKPHKLQIDSGTFWRCAHGVTGYADGLRWIGCIECKKEITDASMDKPSEEVITAYKWADYHRSNDAEIPESAKPLSVALANELRAERAKRLKVEHLADRLGCHGLECVKCSWTFADWQALAHRQLMGEAHE